MSDKGSMSTAQSVMFVCVRLRVCVRMIIKICLSTKNFRAICEAVHCVRPQLRLSPAPGAICIFSGDVSDWGCNSQEATSKHYLSCFKRISECVYRRCAVSLVASVNKTSRRQTTRFACETCEDERAAEAIHSPETECGACADVNQTGLNVELVVCLSDCLVL